MSRRQRIQSLRTRLATIRDVIIGAEGQLVTLLNQLDQYTDERDREKSEAEQLETILTTLVELEQAWRRDFERRLTSHISQGLSAVFAEDIRLKVETRTVRDVTSMELHLVQRGVEIDNIIEGTGGSVVAILDVLLNIMFLISIRPPLQRVIVLDEPFRMVESRHIPALGQLLRELSERLEIQFVIISHETELLDCADVAYEVVPGQEGSTVKRIKRLDEERA